MWHNDRRSQRLSNPELEGVGGVLTLLDCDRILLAEPVSPVSVKVSSFPPFPEYRPDRIYYDLAQITPGTRDLVG